MTARDPRCGNHTLLIAGAILAAAAAAPTSTAYRAQGFEDAEIFIELNDTDGDLGLHASIDGGPWASLEVQAPGSAVHPVSLLFPPDDGIVVVRGTGRKGVEPCRSVMESGRRRGPPV